MPLPRLRFKLRSMMVVVAVVALLLAGIPQGLNLGLNWKEEVRARQAVVDNIDSRLSQSNSWVNSLEIRLARSEQQPVHDPRHEHWLEQIAAWRAIAASSRRDLPIYQRLAKNPWLPFPKGRYDRHYHSASELAYINRLDHRAAAKWSGAGAAAVVLGILMLVLVAHTAKKRLSACPEARTSQSHEPDAIVDESDVTPRLKPG